MKSIDATLEERGTRYGAFMGHADITQGIKNVMYVTDKWHLLANDQKEALEMVAHKIGRILNGDSDYIDSWHDIIGYVRLVEQRLEKEQVMIVSVDEPRSVLSGFAARAKSDVWAETPKTLRAV